MTVPLRVRAYVAVICSCAALSLAAAALQQRSQPGRWWLVQLLLLCVSHHIATWRTVRVARDMTVSLGFVICGTAVLLLGPLGAGVVGLMAAVQEPLRHRPLVKRSFNGAQYCLAGVLSAEVYAVAGGRGQLSASATNLAAVTLAVAMFFLVNSGLVAGVLALTQHSRYSAVLLGSLRETAPAYLVYALLGLAMAALWQVSVAAGLLVLVPVFVARWAFMQYEAQQDAYAATVAALCQAVETKDWYTRGHSERVSLGSVMCARALGMREDRVEAVRFAGMLHDVGKLGVPTRVLQKSGALTDDEFRAIQRHPEQGVEMLRGINFLDEALAGITHHHERLDGRGYPKGLRGDEIPEFGRIIAVADALDAMTSTRSYRSARTVDDALRELRAGAGSQFDPRMVDAMVGAVERQGWRLQEQPAPPSGTGGAHDHDDPTSLRR